ncbi:MAG: hypothetical protein KC635_15420 [Myxococcales bacterium]|nr:hypothetical protein [Myxococcales bacterium]MCB9735519.1 hypothetical protein [Deltaproteobacteria bacterium]
MKLVAIPLSLALLAACADAPAPPAVSDTNVRVSISALTLTGVADAIWDVRVTNGADPAETVFVQRLSASRYGDGAGSVSYVGPCDASEPDNHVELRLVGVYAAAVGDPGDFGDAAPGGFLTVVDPGPMTRDATCLPNADVPVRFDVTVLRPAQQGFFDIALSFDDVFCSAKYDCDAADLLFDASGKRARTDVIGLACTAGTTASEGTRLLLHDIVLDCGSDGAATIDPSAGVGNLCDAGHTDACAAVDDADGLLYQVGVYRGHESLPGLDKVYWNVALGVNPTDPEAPPACTLTTRATVDDGHLGVPGTIPRGVVYPYIVWDVDLTQCPASFALDEGGDVAVHYTTTTAEGSLAFAHAFGGPASDPAPELGPRFVLSQVTTYNAAVLFLDRIAKVHCEFNDFEGMDCRFLRDEDPAHFYVDLKYGYDTPNFSDVDGCYGGYADAVGYNFKEVNSAGGNTAAFECHTFAFQTSGQLFFTAEEKAQLHAWALAGDRTPRRRTARSSTCPDRAAGRARARVRPVGRRAHAQSASKRIPCASGSSRP